MVQVKRASVRTALQQSAVDLFSEQGYHKTTLSEVTARAGTGISSLYSYFPSKLHLLYAAVEPWQLDAFGRLRLRVAAIADRRERLLCILLGVWRDIPMENIGLANALIEALSGASQEEKKPFKLLPAVEAELSRLLAGVLEPDGEPSSASDLLANLVMMAFDGYVINRRLGALRDIEQTAAIMCDALLARADALRPPS